MQPYTNKRYDLSTCNAGSAYRGPPASRKILLKVAGIHRPVITTALRPRFSMSGARPPTYNATEADSRSR